MTTLLWLRRDLRRNDLAGYARHAVPPELHQRLEQAVERLHADQPQQQRRDPRHQVRRPLRREITASSPTPGTWWICR